MTRLSNRREARIEVRPCSPPERGIYSASGVCVGAWQAGRLPHITAPQSHSEYPNSSAEFIPPRAAVVNRSRNKFRAPEKSRMRTAYLSMAQAFACAEGFRTIETSDDRNEVSSAGVGVAGRMGNDYRVYQRRDAKERMDLSRRGWQTRLGCVIVVRCPLTRRNLIGPHRAAPFLPPPRKKSC